MRKRDLQAVVQPYTMASPERIDLLIELADRCNRENIPGDFVECGVCNGGSAAVLAYYAQNTARTVHLFDAFKGLPDITDKDEPSFDGHSARLEVGKCVGDPAKVWEVIKKVGADSCGGTMMWNGWFHEAFPNALLHIKQIAMLNLDSDWYFSEKLCLETWYSKLVIGGFMYLDDYRYWPGAKLAADEFFQKLGVNPEFKFVGHSAWHQKQI